MSLRVQVTVPAKVGTSPGEIQSFTFKADEKAHKAVDAILDYNKAKVGKGESFKLAAKKYGTIIPDDSTLVDNGIIDGDQLELKFGKNIEAVKVFLSTDGNVSVVAINATSKEIHLDFSEPVKKSTKGIAKILQLDSKDDYCFRKLGIKDNTVDVGRYLNVNLSLREQNIKGGAILLLSPVELYFDKPLEQLDFEIRGWMIKNSQKGNKKVTGDKKRYCVLDDNFLFYFSGNKGNTKPAGVIDLEYYNASKENNAIKLETADFAFSNLKIIYTFMCDNEKDTADWYTCLRRHCANGELRRVFGVSLEKALRDQTEILRVIVKCVNYLDKKLDTPGLFKEPGSQSAMAVFREKFDKGEDVDLSSVDDPCTIASLLKLYLRELPNPLIPYSAYDKFMATNGDFDKLKDLVATLPVSHQIALQILLFFFGRVVDHKAKNGMDLSNLCQNMGPVFMSKREEAVDSMVADMQKIQSILKALIEYRFILKFKRSSTKLQINLKNSVQVRALYDYTATGTPNSKGELDMSFKKGDVMKVIEERPGSAWVKAKLNKQEGMVPANYVQKFETDDKVEITKKEEKKRLSTSRSGSKKDVRNDNDSKKDERRKTMKIKEEEVEKESKKSDDKDRKKTIKKDDSKRSNKSSSELPLPPASLPLPPVDPNLLPPPPTDVLPPYSESPDDWQSLYHQEQAYRIKLEAELDQLKKRLAKYEAKYGSL